MSVVDNDTSQEVGASVPSAPPRENLYRAIPDIALERAADGGMPTLTGHFAVWNQWTEIRSAYEGNFMERFSPTAMSKTLAERTPKVLFDHGKDPTVGNKVLGPIRSVLPDDYGAAYAVQLLDTSYNRDLIPGLEAGLYGSSFRFRVLQEDYVSRPARSDFNPKGIPERTVTEAQVMEFGPVTFPAYAGATAGLRSITDTMLEKQLLGGDEMLERLADMIVSRSAQHDRPFTVSFTGSAIEHRFTDLIAGSETRAQWTAAYINNLPDSAFLHIEDGGDKDAEGKTSPRSLRHFPYKDASGNIDLPHLRNALARIPQSGLPQQAKDAATAKAERILAGQRDSESEPSEATTREDLPPGMAEMPDGVQACTLDGTPGYTGGDVCHTHNGTADGMATAMAKAKLDANRAEPEPSGATTQESEAKPFNFRFTPNPSPRKAK